MPGYLTCKALLPSLCSTPLKTPNRIPQQQGSRKWQIQEDIFADKLPPVGQIKLSVYSKISLWLDNGYKVCLKLSYCCTVYVKVSNRWIGKIQQSIHLTVQYTTNQWLVCVFSIFRSLNSVFSNNVLG